MNKTDRLIKKYGSDNVCVYHDKDQCWGIEYVVGNPKKSLILHHFTKMVGKSNPILCWAIKGTYMCATMKRIEGAPNYCTANKMGMVMLFIYEIDALLEDNNGSI